MRDERTERQNRQTYTDIKTHAFPQNGGALYTTIATDKQKDKKAIIRREWKGRRRVGVLLPPIK